MEQNQHGSAATGSGGIGTQDTTLIERVEPSSVVAAGDRLPDHLDSSCSSACLGDTQTAIQSKKVPLEEPEQVEKDTTSQKKGS